jgi:hypothetical protein
MREVLLGKSRFVAGDFRQFSNRRTGLEGLGGDGPVELAAVVGHAQVIDRGAT